MRTMMIAIRQMVRSPRRPAPGATRRPQWETFMNRATLRSALTLLVVIVAAIGLAACRS